MQLPQVINLPITEVCDSQCVMCNVWRAGKTDAFDKESTHKLFSQKGFKKVQHIGLSGGEPTLNENLLDVVDELLDCLPKLQTLSVTSHGYHTDKHALVLPQIKEKCANRNISFSLNISLDGYEKAHQKVRRIEGAFEKAVKTANLARDLGINVQFQCTISPENVFNIVLVREFAIDNGFEIIFRIASYIARLSNENLIERISLNEQQKSFVSDFLTSERTLFAANSLSRRLFYFDLAKRLDNGAKRAAPCAFQDKGLFVSPDTKIYNCSRSEKELLFSDKENIAIELDSSKNNQLVQELIQKTCVDCYHDQNGRWPYWKYFTVHQKIYPWLQLTKKLLKTPTILSKLLFKPKVISTKSNQFNKILIIGMYGGEHVGDAAILGGVILRLMKKFNSSEFEVVSIRPNRTKYWISNLNIPDITIKTISINDLNIKDYQALVLAGGPLMGIPTILSNHISILKQSIQQKIPFFIEGVGIGPINDSISKKLIYKIIKSANHISLRTKSDLEKITHLSNLTSESHDPAFDYLEYLNTKEGKIPDSLNTILDTKKKIWVINLRPLWNRYSKDNDAIQENVLSVIAEIINENSDNARFVFMPMNSDQFGFSDLEMAYKLNIKVKVVAPKADFIVWETEPTIDACIALLKRASLTISMRFHGCIFSLASACNTIGLDYSTRSKGKIAHLFEQQGKAENVLNIKSLSKEEITNSINSFNLK